MADLFNRVVTSYRADTAQAEAAVKRYRGVEREEAKKVLDGLNAHNAKLQDQIALLGKVAAVVGAVVGAAALARSAVTAYLEDVRLGSAAAGANLDGLRAATRGLVEEDRLLEFAGKSMHGTWKLNQAEMERVLRGAMAIRKQFGEELEPTVQKLTEAVAKGATKSLREFGIEAKDKEGTLKELDQLWQDIGGHAGMAGDSMQRSKVKVADAFDNLQGKVGEMVVAMMPAIDSLASFIDLLSDGVSQLQAFADALAGDGSIFGTGQPKWMQLQAQAGGLRAQASDLRAGRVSNVAADMTSQLSGGYQSANLFGGAGTAAIREKMAADLERQAADLEAQVGKAYAKEASRVFAERASAPPGRRSTGGGSAGGFQLDAIELEGVDTGPIIERQRQAAQQFWDSMSVRVQEFAENHLGATNQLRADTNKGLDARADIANSATEGITALQGLVAEFERLDALASAANERGNILGQIIGTPEELDAQIEAIQLASVAMDALRGAAVSMWTEWANGAEISGKKILRALIMQIGQHLAAKATEHTIMGIAEAVTLNPKAATHFAAAAIYASGAVALGATARAMGPGSSGGSSGGRSVAAPVGGGFGGGAGGGAPKQVTRNVTVILEPGFDDLSVRERNARFARSVRRGMSARQSGTIRDG